MNEENSLPKVPEIVEQANAVAERMENANKVRAELLAREEEIEARKILSGRSEAGQSPVQMTEEQKKKEETTEFWKGSEIGKAIEKHG